MKILELGKLGDKQTNQDYKRVINETILTSANEIFSIDLKDDVVRFKSKVILPI